MQRVSRFCLVFLFLSRKPWSMCEYRTFFETIFCLILSEFYKTVAIHHSFCQPCKESWLYSYKEAHVS